MALSGPVTSRIQTADGTFLGVEEYGTLRSDSASIVFLPALGVPVAYYRRLLQQWASQRHVVALEMRGMPQSPIGNLRNADHGYSSALRQDLPALFASPALSGCGAVILIGHSLGGQLALLAAAASQARPQAIVAIGSGTSSARVLSTPLRRLRRRGEIFAVVAISRTVRYWPGNRFGFGGRQTRRTMMDWAFEATKGHYELSSDSFDYEAALKTMTVPALFLSIPGDALMPRAATEYLARRIPGSDTRQLVTTPETSTDHFSWARNACPEVIREAEAWLQDQALES